MKKIILEELANSWDLEIDLDKHRDGSPEAELDNVRQDGYNQGLKEAAKRLRAIIELFQ